MTLSRFMLALVIGISSGMLSYLTAAGMSLVMSGMGVINFGQGAFYILGAFLCHTCTKAGMPFFLALIVSFILPGLVGTILEFLLRPVFGKKMVYSFLITMGASYIITDIMVMIWGNMLRSTALPPALNGALALPFAKIAFPYYYLFIIAVSAVVAIAMRIMFRRTLLGVYFRAIISDRQMVGNLGIDVQKLFTIMFVIGMGLSGLAGALNAPISGMTPKQGLTVLNNVMPVLIIGGTDNIDGCLPAAILLGVASSFAAIYIPTWYNLVPSVLMVIVMLIRPRGLFRKKEA